MVRNPAAPDAGIQDASIETPLDGYELVDFGHGHKLERDIAVMFMVDMSGSTKGWINDAGRESLVLLCESLETPGDRYAIYGFSGMTRKRCEVYRIKRFDEDYSDTVRGRIRGIQPKDYLPHMYGAANYTMIDEVRKLPLKVSDIYRRLTT